MHILVINNYSLNVLNVNLLLRETRKCIYYENVEMICKYFSFIQLIVFLFENITLNI